MVQNNLYTKTYNLQLINTDPHSLGIILTAGNIYIYFEAGQLRYSALSHNNYPQNGCIYQQYIGTEIYDILKLCSVNTRFSQEFSEAFGKYLFENKEFYIEEGTQITMSYTSDPDLQSSYTRTNEEIAHERKLRDIEIQRENLRLKQEQKKYEREERIVAEEEACRKKILEEEEREKIRIKKEENEKQLKIVEKLHKLEKLEALENKLVQEVSNQLKQEKTILNQFIHEVNKFASEFGYQKHASNKLAEFEDAISNLYHLFNRNHNVKISSISENVTSFENLLISIASQMQNLAILTDNQILKASFNSIANSLKEDKTNYNISYYNYQKVLDAAREYYNDENIKTEIEIISLKLDAVKKLDTFGQSISKHINSCYHIFNLALYEAVGKDDLETINVLLELGAKFNLPLENQKLFEECFSSNNNTLLEFLLSKGLNPNTKDSHNYSYLHQAIVNADEDKINIFLKYHAYIDNSSMIAAYNNDSAIFEKLIKAGGSVNVIDVKGYSLLYYNTINNDIAKIDLLLKNKVNIDQSSLETAFNYKNNEIFAKLLTHGGNPSLTNEKNESMLYRAISNKDYEKVDMLIKSGAKIDNNSLILSIDINNPQLLDKLLNLHGDSNCTSDPNNTLLYKAISLGKSDMVDVLLKHKAIIYNEHVEKALILNNMDIFKLLIEYGANVNTTLSNGLTLLQNFVIKNNFEIVKFLLDNKAIIDHGSNYYPATIHIAAENTNADIMKLLLDYGAASDLNKSFYNWNGYIDYFLSFFSSNQGSTSLHLAMKNKHYDVVELLESYGANKHIYDQTGHDYLYYKDHPAELIRDNHKITFQGESLLDSYLCLETVA